jgi:hypothetical protein
MWKAVSKVRHKFLFKKKSPLIFSTTNPKEQHNGGAAYHYRGMDMMNQPIPPNEPPPKGSTKAAIKGFIQLLQCWETPKLKAPCFACAPARPNLYYRILIKANPCLLSKHLNR